MISTLNAYLIRRSLGGLFVAFVVVTSIIMLVDFVEGTRQYGSNDSISVFQVFLLTLLKTPELIEQTIPFIVLFGIMGTLSGLNKRSELIVLRAAGVSAWRFLSPIVWLAGFLGLFWAFAFNPLAAISTQAHAQLLRSVKGVDITAQSLEKPWLREGNRNNQIVIHAQSADLATSEFKDAKFWIFEFDTAGKPTFSYRLDAKTAKWTPGQWQMTQVVENRVSGASSKIPAMTLPTRLSYDDVFGKKNAGQVQSLWKLSEQIDQSRLAGFSTTELKMRMQRLLSLPVTLVAMALIAAGATLHLSRQGHTLRLIITGCILGFSVFFVQNLVGAFGESGSLPVLVAVWMVPFFVLACSAAYLTKIEDG